MAIRRTTIGVATVGLLAALGCGRAAGPISTTPDPRIPTQVLPLSRLYVLEMSGIPPEDTIVTFPVDQPRVIILRHGAPDNTVFVELGFPDSVFRVPDGPDSVTVVVRPRPGVYAVDIATTVVPRRGATIRFKYPVHFTPPLDALRRYGTAGRFERALAISSITDGTNYALLPSERPASDNLQSALPGPGSYVVAAPR
jgi:hypothetical protein